jgi:hypothetical protein
MLQSHIIDVDGVFVGAAIRIDRGYRFVATDYRLEELDSSVWPTLEDVRRLARRTLLAATSAGPISPGLHVAGCGALAGRNVVTADNGGKP